MIHTDSSCRLCKVFINNHDRDPEFNSFVYSLSHDAIKNFEYIVLDGRMITELERIWKEVIME
jgi:hypothetical protein